jgi:hypothetical protein
VQVSDDPRVLEKTSRDGTRTRGGTRLFIAAATTAKLTRQVRQIVESIRFCCA